MLLVHLPSSQAYHTHMCISIYRNFYLSIFHIQHVCPRIVLKDLPLRQTIPLTVSIVCRKHRHHPTWTISTQADLIEVHTHTKKKSELCCIMNERGQYFCVGVNRITLLPLLSLMQQQRSCSPSQGLFNTSDEPCVCKNPKTKPSQLFSQKKFH